jgi:hypothetical protein
MVGQALSDSGRLLFEQAFQIASSVQYANQFNSVGDSPIKTT